MLHSRDRVKVMLNTPAGEIWEGAEVVGQKEGEEKVTIRTDTGFILDLPEKECLLVSSAFTEALGDLTRMGFI